jgi:hypothetical protein
VSGQQVMQCRVQCNLGGYVSVRQKLACTARKRLTMTGARLRSDPDRRRRKATAPNTQPYVHGGRVEVERGRAVAGHSHSTPSSSYLRFRASPHPIDRRHVLVSHIVVGASGSLSTRQPPVDCTRDQRALVHPGPPIRSFPSASAFGVAAAFIRARGAETID